MKKRLLIIGLVVGLSLICPSFAFAEDETKNSDANKTITEIGVLVNAQKYQIAMAKCNNAIQKYPNEAFLYYWRGSIYNSIGERQLAIQDFDKSIELDASNSKAYVLRGICKSDLEDKEGALEDYNKAIELNPNDGSAYSMRAMVRLDLGDMDGADKDLDLSNKLLNGKVNDTNINSKDKK